jgi:hypothetical protein
MRHGTWLGVWLLASCQPPEGDGADTDSTLDTEASVDHGTDDNGGDDTDRSACQSQADYGRIPQSPGSVAFGAVSGMALEQKLTDGLRYDLLAVGLYPNTPTFPDQIAAGTYTIGPDDAQYETCGLCLRIVTQLNPDDGTWGEMYLAKSGSVTLTEVEDGVFGTLEGVTFQHVDIDELTLISTVHPDGCTTAVHGDLGAWAPEFACDDGADNDRDGLTDCQDDDCAQDTGSGC